MQLGRHLFQLCALLSAAGVIPQDGRTQGFTRGIKQYRTVHLSGKANSFYRLPAVTALLPEGGNQVFGCLPPGFRRLFRPVRIRTLYRQRRAMGGDNAVVFVNDQRLYF